MTARCHYHQWLQLTKFGINQNWAWNRIASNYLASQGITRIYSSTPTTLKMSDTVFSVQSNASVEVESFLHYFTDNITLPTLCIFRYILCTLYRHLWCMTSGSCSTDYNVFLNGKKILKKKKMYLCTFPIAAHSQALFPTPVSLHWSLSSNTFLLPFPPQHCRSAIDAAMLGAV